MHKFKFITLFLPLSITQNCAGFTLNSRITREHRPILNPFELHAHAENQTSRRESFQTIALTFGLGSTSALFLPQNANAAESQPTIYKSGKAPIVAGQKPQDKGDLKGTKKDPNFLRSISQCKSQCEQTTDKDGFAKSKEECLSDCQDICCTTYEQCTFGIVPRI